MALQLSQSGLQKVLSRQQSQPRTTSVAQSASTQPQPQQPSGVDQDLGKTKSALSMLMGANRATGNQGGQAVSGGLAGLNAAAQAAQGIRDIQQGRTFAGSLQLGGAATSAAANPYLASHIANLTGTTAGTVGQVAGVAGAGLGLLGAGYGLYQNRAKDLDPGQLVGMVQGTGQFAGSAGSLIGGAAAASQVAPMVAGGAGSALSTGAGLGAGLTAAGAGLGAIGGVMGIGMGLGTAINNFASGDDRQLGSGIGTLAGMGVGAGVGTLIAPGIGTIIGAGLGAAAGGALGSLFGQNLPHYMAVRAHAGDVGQDAAKEYTDAIIRAGESGDISEVQKALGSGYANNHVRVDLNLPEDVAQKLGIAPNAPISSLSTPQFFSLLKAYSDREGVNSDWFVGSGDVPYLGTKSTSEGNENFIGRTSTTGPAQQIASRVANVARGTFDTMTKFFKPQLDQMPAVAPLTWENVGDYRVAPELIYKTYNTHTGEPNAGAPTWDKTDLATIKQQIQAGNVSGLMGSGTAIGRTGDESIKSGGIEGVQGGFSTNNTWYAPTSVFAANRENPNAVMAESQRQAQQAAQQQLQQEAQQRFEAMRAQGIGNETYLSNQAATGDPLMQAVYQYSKTAQSTYDPSRPWLTDPYYFQNQVQL